MSNTENMAESQAVSAKKEEPMVSLAFHPLAVGNPGDKEPTLEETLAVLSILKNAGICCFFVDEFALIYYGAGRVLNVRAHITFAFNLKTRQPISNLPYLLLGQYIMRSR